MIDNSAIETAITARPTPVEHVRIGYTPMKYHWKYMRSIIDWIEDRLDSDLTLEDIAAHARCSRYHFERIFREQCGITVLAYVRKRAHLHAIRDICNGATISDSALRYGYQSSSTFARAFRRTYGVTPGAYRAMVVRSAHDSSSYITDIKTVRDEGILRQAYDLADFALKLSSKSHNPYTYDYFHEQCMSKSPFLLYVTVDGRVVGVAFGVPQRNNNVTVAFAAVEPDFRHRGIGRSLMAEMIVRVRDEGYEGMAMGSNRESEEFLCKCGFAPTLFLQSNEHSLDELRAVNDRYKELWGRESGVNGWRQLMLETPEIDTELRRKYDEKFDDCIPQIVFRMRFDDE